MAQNHIQEGDVMPFTNASGSTITGGSVVSANGIIGVNMADVANGAVGQLAVEEVFSVPKAAPLVISQGDKLYWSVANGTMSKTTTDVYAGRAFADAASAATTVQVNLGVI